MGDAAVGTVSAIDYLPQIDSKLNRAFVKAFRASYGGDRQPNYVAVAVYDVLGAIYRVAAAQNGALDPDKSLDLLKNLAFESPRGPVRIERSGNGWAYRRIAAMPMVEDPTEDPDS